MCYVWHTKQNSNKLKVTAPFRLTESRLWENFHFFLLTRVINIPCGLFIFYQFLFKICDYWNDIIESIDKIIYFSAFSVELGGYFPLFFLSAFKQDYLYHSHMERLSEPTGFLGDHRLIRWIGKNMRKCSVVCLFCLFVIFIFLKLNSH